VESTSQGCVDTIRITQGAERKHFQDGGRKVGGTRFKSCKCNSSVFGKECFANVQNLSSAKELWEKLEGLYQAKGISNGLLLKEQFHNLRMNEGSKISDHLSTLKNIVSELESIEVKIDDEDKLLRLIFFPCTFLCSSQTCFDVWKGKFEF